MKCRTIEFTNLFHDVDYVNFKIKFPAKNVMGYPNDTFST